MQVTLTHYVRFGIVRQDGDEPMRSYMHWIPTNEAKKIRKINKEMFDDAVNALSSDRMFDRHHGMKGKEYRKFLAECLDGIAGIKNVKIKYSPASLCARVSYVFDHDPTDAEKLELMAAEEAQFVDGYGENPFFLFEGNDGIKYYLSF